MSAGVRRGSKLSVHTAANGSHALEPRNCYQCDGSGGYDYGSKSIPTLMDGSIRVDCDGRVIGRGEVISSYVPSYEAYQADPYGGGTVTSTLRRLIPGMSAYVVCPACTCAGSVESLIPHLNDSERWPREQIADWLGNEDKSTIRAHKPR